MAAGKAAPLAGSRRGRLLGVPPAMGAVFKLYRPELEVALPVPAMAGQPSPVVTASMALLSSGEWNFLCRLAEGQSYLQIAEGMNVSINTVRTYVRSVYKKLQVNSRTKAVIKYFQARSQSAALSLVDQPDELCPTGRHNFRIS